MKHSECKGSILMELVITVPVVLVLLLAGVILVQIASTKASLQMTVSRAARELAAQEVDEKKLASGKLYHYGEFTETYGLPRAHVQMLVGRLTAKEGSTEANYIVAGACYRVQAPFPRGTPHSDVLAQPMSMAKDLLPNNALLEQLQGTINNADAAYQEGENLWQRVQNIWDKLLQVTVHLADTVQFVPYPNEKQQQSFSSQDEFDAAVRTQCGGKLDVIVNTRAAFWLEQHVETADKAEPTTPATPATPGAPAEKKQKHVELVLNPSEVVVKPFPNLAQTTATVTASWENANCSLQVKYKENSEAQGLTNRIKAPSPASSTSYRWTWNVGSGTEHSARVTATCDGITVVRLLTIYKEGVQLPWEE